VAALTLQQILTPGNVLDLFCDFTTPQKNKLLILASTDPRLVFFIINSELTEFRSRTEEIKDAQVEIKKVEHAFLTKDSWADCSKAIHLFDVQEVARQINSKTGAFKGVLHDNAKAAIRAVVKDSRLLENRDKTAILQSL